MGVLLLYSIIGCYTPLQPQLALQLELQQSLSGLTRLNPQLSTPDKVWSKKCARGWFGAEPLHAFML